MDSDHTSPTERLWTPWRMHYISGNAKEEGCIFCNRLSANNDITSLILHRAEHTFVIMNLYPYNTGHIMLIPNQHASDPDELSSESLREMGEALPLLTTTLRRVFGCDGFNVGLNIGAVAGAGVAAHLHEHIVPRWLGDANFMPIMASTMVIPETIPVTYAKIRAELLRDTTGASTASFVLLDTPGERALICHGRLPIVDLEEDLSVWESVFKAIPEGVTSCELAGWAGNDSSREAGSNPVILTVNGTVSGNLPTDWEFVSIDADRLDPDVRQAVLRARAQRAPSI